MIRMMLTTWVGSFWEPKFEINSFTLCTLLSEHQRAHKQMDILKAKQILQGILPFLLMFRFLILTGRKPRFEMQIGFMNLLSLSSSILAVVSPIRVEKSQ